MNEQQWRQQQFLKISCTAPYTLSWLHVSYYLFLILICKGTNIHSFSPGNENVVIPENTCNVHKWALTLFIPIFFFRNDPNLMDSRIAKYWIHLINSFDWEVSRPRKGTLVQARRYNKVPIMNSAAIFPDLSISSTPYEVHLLAPTELCELPWRLFNEK